MSPDGDLPARVFAGPLCDYGQHPLKVADVRLVHNRKYAVGDFVAEDAEHIGLQRLRVKVDRAAAVVADAFAKVFGRRALDADGPPFAVELEAHTGNPLLAPRLACGALFHLRR